MKWKYQENDYIVLTGNCSPNLLGRTVRVHKIFTPDHYMIDVLMDEVQYYPIWGKANCEANSHINTAMTVLFKYENMDKA